MRHRSPLRNRLEYWAVRILLASLSRGPFSFSFALARRYVRLLDLLVPRLRKVAQRNLELTGMPAHCVEGTFLSLSRLLAVLARFPRINRGNISEWIRYEGYEHFEQALRKGKGVLFATAHLGNWELSAFAHALLSAPMQVVVRPLDNPLLDRLATHIRSLSGNEIIGKRDYVRGILRALAKNQAVGILVDQNVGLDEGVFVEFFGRQACVSPGFAKLAWHCGATVIPGFAVWSGDENRYILRFYPPVAMAGDPVLDTQRIQAAVEHAIRQYPDQWLWIHRRWKTRPAGEALIY